MHDDDIIDQAIDETAQRGQPEERRGGAVAGWLASGALHAVAIATMALVVYAVSEPLIETPPVPIAALPFVEKPKPPVERDRIDPKEMPPIEVAQPVDQPVANVPDTPDVPVDEMRDDSQEQEKAAGEPTAVTDAQLAGASVFMAIGANSNASGPLGQRGKGKGPRSKTAGIPNPAGVDQTIERALRWLKRHQGPDGAWDVATYQLNCTEAPRCEPGEQQSGDTTVAMTGLAVLCFLGHGETAKFGRYKTTIRKALDYLAAKQQPDGLVGKRNYEHSIATMALAEAYAMDGDPALKQPAAEAAKLLLARQNRDGAAKDPAYAGLGWDYSAPSQRNDASVTGWAVMALKSAFVAGVVDHGALEQSKTWLDRAFAASNPQGVDPYGTAKFAYVWKTGEATAETAADGAQHHEMSSVGLACGIFLGHRRGDPIVDGLSRTVAKFHTPTAWPMNLYYVYYGSLGMFQVGGEEWKSWAKAMYPLLTANQRRDGCFDGSWDSAGGKFHGSAAGRVLSTTLACLTAEVYERYQRVAGK